jgi:hypothetical protein
MEFNITRLKHKRNDNFFLFFWKRSSFSTLRRLSKLAIENLYLCEWIWKDNNPFKLIRICIMIFSISERREYKTLEERVMQELFF